MDHTTYLRRLTPRARAMRSNPSPAEQKLWSRLRNRQLNGLRFRRQQPVGPYIADFYCAEHKLVIEADGDSHTDDPKYDRRRDEYMRQTGLRVLRFTNPEIFDNLDAVLTTILEATAK